MSPVLFCATAAIWLTGMVPLAAADACGHFDDESWGSRLLAYWAWWLLLPYAVIVAIKNRSPDTSAPPLRAGESARSGIAIRPATPSSDVEAHLPHGQVVEPTRQTGRGV
jgi:hypothetical protein